jgi:hypothetical protein
MIIGTSPLRVGQELGLIRTAKKAPPVGRTSGAFRGNCEHDVAPFASRMLALAC